MSLLASATLLAAPLATAELLCVDTETNGKSGEACELTEVGAVLVGGGELHERWDCLVGVTTPLGRGIQRFTGISQAMVDRAPPPETVLAELAERMRGRVLVAHSARFDERVLRQAFSRAGLDWPAPPVLCTVALARKLAPLHKRRGLALLAEALGIEVEATHRALPDAETCARVLCALFGRLCAAAETVGDAVALLAPRRRAGGGRSGGVGGGSGGASALRRRAGVASPIAAGATRVRPPHERPDLASLPKDPGVYVFRDADGCPLYVGKSICLRTRARAHFLAPSSPDVSPDARAPAAWTAHATQVDHLPTHSELGALVLEGRLIRALQPPGNVRGKAARDGLVYLACRLDAAYPVLEVTGEPLAGPAVCVGPVRGRAAATELVEQLASLFGLRHCGRRLVAREHPSAYGQMGRCLSPCLGDLDPNLYRERLDAALALFDSTTGREGREALLAHVEGEMRRAAHAQAFERAAWLRRRLTRLDALLGRLGGVLRATHAGARLVLAPHPSDRSRCDAFWVVSGRVVDWGLLSSRLDVEDLGARTREALRQRGAAILGEEVDEVRLMGAWLARGELASLDLERVDGAGVARWVEGHRAREGGAVRRAVR